MSATQRRELLGKFESLFPSLTSGEAHRLIHDDGFWQAIARLIAERQESARALISQPSYPKVGEIFSLKYDPTAQHNHPDDLPVLGGYARGLYTFVGAEIMEEEQAKQFALRSTADCKGIEAVRTALGGVSVVPLGQWFAPFVVNYPKHDGGGRIGIADPSWQNPSGHLVVPYIDELGHIHFMRSDTHFDKHWRWIVLAPAAEITIP